MEIETIKKIIADKQPFLNKQVQRIEKAEKYYRNHNDILHNKNPVEKKNEKVSEDNPLRNADNRISLPWHQLLVDQKAAYTMTVPPAFDVDDKNMNEEITKLLGDIYPKVAKDLAVNASNAGIAWIHVWRDEEHDNFFRYGVVDSKQVIPVYSKKLDKHLEGILRIYEDYNEAGDTIQIFEYWNETEVSMFSKVKAKDLDGLESFDIFELIDVATNVGTGQFTNTYQHKWDSIPFIPFRNNPLEQSDLDKYKGLIDTYDKVYSGFTNDVDDIQEIILVLTNYGGEDKAKFLKDLKQFKMIKVDNVEGDKSGVDTLAIDIPVEARTKLLELTRESIFTHGQGVDPQKNIGQNQSGVALRYMYSLLELKASMLETEFRLGFAELVRFILKYSNKDSDVTIKQTWTRSAINNDLEQAEIVAKVATFTSVENVAKSNPLVDDWETEVENLNQEKEDDFRATDDYRNKSANDDLDEGEEDDE